MTIILKLDTYNLKYYWGLTNRSNSSSENLNEEIVFNDSIKLNNVSFNCGEKILKNINLKIKKNETIVIAGKSGSGKTYYVK